MSKALSHSRHAFHAIFRASGETLNNAKPHKFDLLHLNFHHRATTNLKTHELSYLYVEMCGCRWMNKKKSSIVCHCCPIAMGRNSWNPIWGRFSPKRCVDLFWFEKRRLNSNIKCDTKIWIRFAIFGNARRFVCVCMLRIWQKITMFTKLEYLMVWSFTQRNGMVSHRFVLEMCSIFQADCNVLRLNSLGSMSQKLWFAIWCLLFAFALINISFSKMCLVY